MSWGRCMGMLNQRDDDWLEMFTFYYPQVPVCFLPYLNELLKSLHFFQIQNPDGTINDANVINMLMAAFWVAVTFFGITFSDNGRSFEARHGMNVVDLFDYYILNQVRDHKKQLAVQDENKFEIKLKQYGLEENIPDRYVCPIYKHIMMEPVIPLLQEENGGTTRALKQHVLDKSSYEKIMKEGNGRCPFTRKPYVGFVPDVIRKKQIANWMQATIKQKKKALLKAEKLKLNAERHSVFKSQTNSKMEQETIPRLNETRCELK